MCRRQHGTIPAGNGVRPMPTSPRTRARYHYKAAEAGIADLGKLGLDDAAAHREVLVAICHAILALGGNDDRGRHETHASSPAARTQRPASHDREAGRCGSSHSPRLWRRPRHAVGDRRDSGRRRDGGGGVIVVHRSYRSYRHIGFTLCQQASTRSPPHTGVWG